MKIIVKISVFLLSLTYANISFAQFPGQQINVLSMSGPPSSYAIEVFKDVKKVLGVPCNQIELASNMYIPNAMAVAYPKQVGFNAFQGPIYQTQQLILYNPKFMAQIEVSTDSKWAAIGIIAHEVGHHINNDATPQNPYDALRHPWQKELEADFYTGKTLALLGANVDDLQKAQRQMFTLWGSPSHPDTIRRIQRINEGWRAGGGAGSVQTNLEQIWNQISNQMQKW